MAEFIVSGDSAYNLDQVVRAQREDGYVLVFFAKTATSKEEFTEAVLKLPGESGEKIWRWFEERAVKF